MKYKWLHISDLHSICKGFRTKIMKDRLLDEIELSHEESRFSFLLITGDISDKNSGYKEAEELIEKIIDKLELSTEKVFIVPGNHDVNRNIPENRKTIALEKWSLEILDNIENTTIETLVKGQNSFFETYKNILGREYPIESLHYIENVNKDISIIHLNTSWMCFDSENESNNLHIGLNKLYNCLNPNDLNKIKIAIGHHPLNDLRPQVKKYIKSMFKSTKIDFYLSGHCHKANAKYSSINNIEFCSCSQVRAEDDNYPAGFIIGNIDLNNNENHFKFYSWNSTYVKWMYDYSVEEARHGKYYFKGDQFKNSIKGKGLEDTIIDLKLFGTRLNINKLKEELDLQNSRLYNVSLQDIRPKSAEEWNSSISIIKNLYNEVVKGSNGKIHILPIASIPLLVSFGYLLQNNSSNILIYQYIENEEKWVYDQEDENIQPEVEYTLDSKEKNDKLAVAVNVSGLVKLNDIKIAIGSDFDLLKTSISGATFSKLNYKADVVRFKKALKTELDLIHSDYKEIHLFLASPAGLCIEIGRIIRESTYPNTYIYNYDYNDPVKYKQIINLKEI